MTSSAAPTIALFGLFGCHNLGNEATLAATVHGLRQRLPTARLILVSDPPPPESRLPDFPQQWQHDLLPVGSLLNRVKPYRLKTWARPLLTLTTEPLRFMRTLQLTRKIDQILIAGTGIADDYCQGPFDTPIDLQRWCSAVQTAGGKVRFLSIGAGPVSHWLSVRWFRKALACADYRSYREVSSHQFARDIGLDAGNDPVLPDLVFSLPVEDYLARRPLQWPPKVVGLGVMGYRGWNVDTATGERIYADYLDKLTHLVHGLLDKGMEIRLLTGNRGSDQRTVLDLLARLNHAQKNQVTAANIQSYHDVLEQIAGSDLVIATRFHNVLKALLLERPVISIEYGHKNSDLMAAMGLAHLCHVVETFDPVHVFEQIEKLAAMPTPPVEFIKKRVAEYKKQLQDQFDWLAAEEK